MTDDRGLEPLGGWEREDDGPATMIALALIAMIFFGLGVGVTSLVWWLS